VDIQGKVAIITGASAGIGLAAARLFAEKGAKVALVARSGSILAQIAQELPDALAVPADLSDVAQVPGVIEAVHAHYGRIDVLVNNAGRAFHTPIEHADTALFQQLLNLNVVSVVRAMQCVIPIMRAQGGGVIVNISSGLTRGYLPGVGPYAASKYALNALSHTARAELADDHISVGVVIPGRTMNTRFHENAYARMARPQPPRPLAGNVPRRADTPEGVAEAILEAVQSEAAETFTASTRARE